ncbi:tRNA (carboxymethyluridine(34)-5-O)-methyltransferase alkbh8-like [Glandiceps talaboti]
MATSMDKPWSSLSKSQQQKLRRKQLRSQHTLMRHEGIETVQSCTKNIFVGNGGLGNGIQREDLQDVFGPFGRISTILLIQRKPYAFVCFTDSKDAEKAFDTLQGKTFRFHEETVTFYLSYVEKVPTQCSSDKSMPPGLFIIEDFITMEMEKNLLESIAWDTDEVGVKEDEKILKHRRVKHYGYEFRYDTNNVDKDKPLPSGISLLHNSVIDDIMKIGHVNHRPDQITVNQYQPGQGIPPHIDTHSAFEDEIISLSLGSEVVMDFKHPDNHHIPVLVPQRSLLIMTGESRYMWTHGITPRKHDVVPADHMTSTDVDKSALTLHKRSTRTSFTFRAIRHGPCKCAYPAQCDTQQSKTPDSDRLLPTSEYEAAYLEKQHVHEVYDVIAEHFSGTRHSPWPKVAEFLKQQPDGAILADIGCGNGKYLGINKQLFEIGCDRSVNLIDICQQRGFEAFVCDALSVPLRSNSCDVVISIAVIHHLSTQERRLQAIREIVRILRCGGQALVYVWAMEQERFKVKSKYLKGAKKMITSDGEVDVKHKDGEVLSQNSARNEDIIKSDAGESCVQNVEQTGETDVDSLEKNRKQKSESDVRGVEVQREYKNVPNAEACNMGDSNHGAKSDIASNQDEMSSKVDATQRLTTKGNVHSSSTLPVHINRTAFEKQDLLVPWHLKEKGGKRKEEKGENTGVVKDGCSDSTMTTKSSVFHRFYHVFKEGELETLCKQCNNVKVMKVYYDQGNWCVILAKT